jgi:hypothetical protein
MFLNKVTHGSRFSSLWTDMYKQDKILQSNGHSDSIQVTNDGATILKAIGVDNPAAKVLVGKSILSLASNSK